ncbi:MAG: substrate-binding domain-containing protein, partial [Candidatus Competibacterales bacterium]|nr:substrate-binding domain-containing protein [Candidatus Competibacterales bacterium]
MFQKKKLLFGTVTMALALGAGAAQADSHSVLACLITKTDTNPFFVKMKDGAAAKAEELGIELSTFAGKLDGDVETQVAAVESCIAAGAKGILIT